MTAFVQNLLQQMQSRFRTMSDSVITKNILFLISFAKCIGRVVLSLILIEGISLHLSEMNQFHWYCMVYVRSLAGFLDCNALDDMGTRIDELEQSIDDLRSEMGLEGSPSPSVPPKAKAEPNYEFKEYLAALLFFFLLSFTYPGKETGVSTLKFLICLLRRLMTMRCHGVHQYDGNATVARPHSHDLSLFVVPSLRKESDSCRQFFCQ
ncbi:hypothetical protein SADUNF_Sadunf08G0166200 [Salix dunnii]|uniref:Uncharacterized protein n=1 Tax=Salix dunnii TaxID=1413687 RepID=A0A835JXS3_9ROSI|nr:hypothetical protein SADUNF_Sadunf08G0166200 [Salix dunnii]